MSGDEVDQPVTMLAERIEKCVECGYSFAGLPLEAGACPECGLKYDEWSRVYVSSPTRKHLIGMVIFWSMMLVQFGLYLKFLRAESWQDPFLIVIVLLIGGVLSLGLIHLWRLQQGRYSGRYPWIGCVRDGCVVFQGIGTKPSFHPWSAFSKYRQTQSGGFWGIALRCHELSRITGMPKEVEIERVFRQREVFDEFLAMVDHYLECAADAAC